MLTKYVLLNKEYMAEPLMVFDSEEDAKQMQEAINGGSILELPYIAWETATRFVARSRDGESVEL